MNFAERVVLDTSTLVSAAIRVGSIPHQAFLKAMGGYEVCASAETLHELNEVLLRPKFNRYLARSERDTFLELYESYAVLVEVRESVKASRDPRDDKFLALVAACGASVLVSSDKDLLVLKSFKSIPIIKAADFLVFEPER